MSRPGSEILAIIIGGLTAYAGYYVLDMAVGLSGPPETAPEVGLLAGIERSLSMLTPTATGAIVLVVGALAYLAVRGR